MYHFDRVFCTLLNKIGKVKSMETSTMPSHTLATYHNTIYDLREQHFIAKIEQEIADLGADEKIVCICGRSHVKRITEHFNR